MKNWKWRNHYVFKLITYISLTCWGTLWVWLTGLNWGLEGGELEELDGVGFGLSRCCPWELRNVEFIEISRDRPIEPINNVAGFIACFIVLYFWLLLLLVNIFKIFYSIFGNIFFGRVVGQLFIVDHDLFPILSISEVELECRFNSRWACSPFFGPHVFERFSGSTTCKFILA